ncbi:hypothetical protein LWI29_019958 [Acer saccharum]|uniref:BED-type domain-containing protein n=1 Tax=Acer saccharum TaxID=4024 RepID=A0AA39S8F8_ACESA|nr:hypothetical protein LWI29_019958 [Acer saccharum]
MPDIDTPLDFDYDPPEVELQDKEDLIRKWNKSDLFTKYMKKVRKEDGNYVAACNYCTKTYKWCKSGGYGTYWKHIETKHLDAITKTRSQSQIPRQQEIDQEPTYDFFKDDEPEGSGAVEPE